jgi:hypothetical protein
MKPSQILQHKYHPPRTWNLPHFIALLVCKLSPRFLYLILFLEIIYIIIA